jgi:hypothetical protein
LNRLREENAAHQQANRVLEEEKMKILEKLKQIRKEKSASDDGLKPKKKEILRKENETSVPVPLTSIQVPNVPETVVKTETTQSVKLTDSLNALTMKTMQIKELYVELKKYKEELAKIHNMSPVAVQLFENEKFNCSKPAKGRRYTDSIRNLSVNPSFYSQAGYEKLRTIFTLPSLTSIKNHLAKVGCASGILKNALAEIQHKISEGHLAEATLSLDGTAIKKGIHWDSKLKKYFGFDEFPSVQTAGSDKKNGSVATEALVYYLVSIDGRWKTPVASYFTKHVDSNSLAKLTTEILVECANFGVKVTSIVFDGLPTNIQMTTHLGANLKLPEVTTTTKRRQKSRVTTKNDLTKPFSPYFKHPSTNETVYVMLDACHMLKLARGLLAMPQGVLLPGFRIPAKWNYIKELFEFQNKTGFRLGNRLTRNHAYFQRHKMKVALAAQVLSQSVADALRHLRVKLKVPRVIININSCNFRPCIVTDQILEMFQKFASSEATEEYFCRFNKLFDILNSWNINAKGDKEPLNKTNLEEKKKDLKDLTKFLKQLKLPNGRLVSVSKRKTCVIGFLATIKSTIMLSSELLNKSDEPLDYIATRHMQQDPFPSRTRYLLDSLKTKSYLQETYLIDNYLVTYCHLLKISFLNI